MHRSLQTLVIAFVVAAPPAVAAENFPSRPVRQKQIRDDFARWGKVVKLSGAKVD